MHRRSRPTVLHAVRHWGIPSERFVVELVGSTTRTRPVVVFGQRAGGADGPLRSYPVGRLGRRRPRRALIATVALAERARVFHAHLGYWAGEAAAAARKLRRPLIVSLHGQDLLVGASTMEEPRALTDADVVIVPSQFLAAAAERFGVREERIRIIPSGVDLKRLCYAERFRGHDGRVRVTFAGRFVQKKGVLDAARALAEVARHRPELEARFVGYGHLQGELRSLLRELGLVAEIRDGTAPDAITSAFSDTHLLISPSRTAPDGDAESLGLVNLEALASGIPVVTTRNGGIPEALCPEAAVMVEEGVVAALASAVDELLDKPSRWPAMGRAGRAHVTRHFDLRTQVDRVEAEYMALLRRS